MEFWNFTLNFTVSVLNIFYALIYRQTQNSMTVLELRKKVYIIFYNK